MTAISRKVILSFFVSLLLAAFFVPNASAGLFDRKSSGEQRAQGGEYIIVSGGPALRKWETLRRGPDQHDRWWGNFVRAAKFRMKQLLDQNGPDTSITWMVYRPAYSARAQEQKDPLLAYVESVRDDYFARDLKFPIKLVWFDEGQDVIRYLNGRPKGSVSGFEYFGHSNRHAFMFDYSNSISGVSRALLHEKDLGDIKGRVFAKNAFCKSWGCHSAESFSKTWRAATGTKMWGAVGKTDFRSLAEGNLPVISDGGVWQY